MHSVRSSGFICAEAWQNKGIWAYLACTNQTVTRAVKLTGLKVDHANRLHIILSTTWTTALTSHGECEVCQSVWNWRLSLCRNQWKEEEEEVSGVKPEVTGRRRRGKDRTGRGKEKTNKDRERDWMLIFKIKHTWGTTEAWGERDKKVTSFLPSCHSSWLSYSSSSLYQRFGNLQHKTQVEMMNWDREQRKDGD